MAAASDYLKGADEDEHAKCSPDLSEKETESEVDLVHHTFDPISDKIDAIEKDLDFLLDMLEKRNMTKRRQYLRYCDALSDRWQ